MYGEGATFRGALASFSLDTFAGPETMDDAELLVRVDLSDASVFLRATWRLVSRKGS
jgi:hypothetical protein